MYPLCRRLPLRCRSGLTRASGVFDLYYYDELAKQSEEIRLTVGAMSVPSAVALTLPRLASASSRERVEWLHRTRGCLISSRPVTRRPRFCPSLFSTPWCCCCCCLARHDAKGPAAQERVRPRAAHQRCGLAVVCCCWTTSAPAAPCRARELAACALGG